MRFTLRLCALSALITGMCLPAHAAVVYDAAADFTQTTTSNPNGVWSYGYDPAGNVYLRWPFTTLGIGYWNSYSWAWNLGNPYVPLFQKNLGDTSGIGGIAVGQVGLHPGPAGTAGTDDAAILRFTAPVAGVYDVQSQFFNGDFGETEAWIVMSGDFSTAITLGVTSLNPSWNRTALSLAAGDTIDFVVGRYDSHFGDTTPLNVSIRRVPEPGTLALFGLGLAGIGALRRRRLAA